MVSGSGVEKDESAAVRVRPSHAVASPPERAEVERAPLESSADQTVFQLTKSGPAHSLATPSVAKNLCTRESRQACQDRCMTHGDPRPLHATGHGVFAMDPEPTLRQVARHLVVTQQQMAALGRYTETQRAAAADSVHLPHLLAVWEGFQQQWTMERLPSLIAAMRLALEVYDTFGPGMIRLGDPIEAGIWNNKYFVWERELKPVVHF